MNPPGYTSMVVPIPRPGDVLVPTQPPEGSIVRHGLAEWRRDGDGWRRSDQAHTEPAWRWDSLVIVGPLMLVRWGLND